MYVYEKIFFKIFIIIAIIISVQGQCSRVESEIVAKDKTKILKHNYILVNSVNNTPAQVEVSYSVFMAGNTENTVKAEILTTPFIIGGEDVQVLYDSIGYRLKGKPDGGQSVLKRGYASKGADFLSIKNLSNADLEYCVIGNQPLKYYPVSEIDNWSNLSNKNQIDKSKVVKYSPTPIYKSTPVLYLFKPELAPQKEVYVPWAFGSCDGVSCSISDVQAKLISLKTPVFGEVTADSPLSISEIIGLYREEYNAGYILYQDYQKFRRGQISSVNQSVISERLKIKHYGTIPANQTLSNTGQVWFVNTYQGFYANDNID